MSLTRRRWLAGLAYGLLVVALIWPGATIANRIEPFVLAVPFFIFWYALWGLLMFIGLVALYWLDGRGRA